MKPVFRIGLEGVDCGEHRGCAHDHDLLVAQREGFHAAFVYRRLSPTGRRMEVREMLDTRGADSLASEGCRVVQAHFSVSRSAIYR